MAERESKFTSDQVNMRHANENIIPVTMDVPDRNTQQYEGSDMVMKVQKMLIMSLHDNGDDERTYVNNGNNGFMAYPTNSEEEDDGKEKKSDRPKSSRKSRK